VMKGKVKRNVKKERNMIDARPSSLEGRKKEVTAANRDIDGPRF